MKRLLSGIATVGLLLCAPAAMAGVEGDYNADGVVDDLDKDIIFSSLNTTTDDPEFVPAADHDGDGVISLVDVGHFSKIYQAQ